MVRPSLYVETTIFGYLTNRPSANILIEGRRQLTLQWWQERRSEYELFVSEIVLDEVSQGDAAAIRDRQALISGLPLLRVGPEIMATADRLVRVHALPTKAFFDAYHLATAAHHHIDILVTWNCTHIANPHILRLVRRSLTDAGLWMPEVVTPESLMGDKNG
jgi:predicted nucleic acid-binding protein